ncbi:trafficking protein Mon1-domain-containing protein [Sphaerosporella brunnea]|uniref:Vacuolar fusion protein MON1 n=1 Tax=Sphaerosporella brunnea TaxID=1250544 RepID=A0A5J5F0I9_9PEZI|nr:trafficking protein Mon1-domain-containing protein [Sphaerosporella brunnea]
MYRAPGASIVCISPIGKSLLPGRQLLLALIRKEYLLPAFLSSSSYSVGCGAWGGHYTTQSSRRRVMTLYHKLHASVHAKSAHLKVCFCSRKQEETLAWVLPGFELYVVAAPGAKREAVAKGAQKIVNWVRNEEERLFVIGGATF